MKTLGKFTGLAVSLLLLLSSLASGSTQGAPGTHSPHGTLNIPCQNCHTAAGWRPIRAVPEFNHDQTHYPLRGMHQNVTCIQCHVKPVFNNVGTRCQDCHADIHKRQLGANCEQCHTVRGWGVSIKEIQQHNNRFPLTGAHAAVDCDSCHKNAANSKFQIMSTMCYSCHEAEYKSTTAPSHVANAYSTTCDQCHGTDNWLSAKFDHNSVGFPLTGGHAVPPRACTDCHANNNFNLTSTACIGCHQKDFQGATNPSHLLSGFSTTCQQCHTTIAWQPATFDHSKTAFPLTGSHTVPPRQCADCHINNNYNITDITCISCHQKDFTGATSPVPHTGFPTTCQQCHDTMHWTDGKFDHAQTGWTLTGSHMVPPRACIDCHISNNYNITNTTCISCHQNDFNNATTPVPHAGFPTNCEQCHDTMHWTDGKFDHSQTGFTLTGMHTDPPRTCTDCHINNNYNLTSTACYSCHQKDFVGAKNPDHVAGGFAQTCEVCHSTTAWQPATFDHSKSAFPLTGSHMVPPRACADCHVNNNYNITNITCISCHLTDFQNATSPVPHAGFPTTCEQCHDTIHWTDGKFDHSQTGWPLTNSHMVPPRACTDCHVNNNYNITVTTCISCHQNDYNNAKSPVPHTGFPTTCEQCHDTIAWTDGKFDHSQTGWPLTNSHMVPPRACTDCHVNNNYNITVTTCISCHQNDYNNAKSPVPHTGFPTTCEQCHDTIAWTDGKFDHSQTGWPLTNSHMVPPRVCTDCHVNNNYNITVTTCISCHQNDYNNAKSPVPHTGFPTTCEQCHDTIVWTDGKFDHSQTGFPLTGSHMVPPRACTDCHINNNYNLNSTLCITCHQTDFQNATTPVPHTGFPTTCELCHDTIKWTDATFNHNNTPFPLTGSHMVPPRACVDCHVNGNYTTLPTACIGCHQTDYNNTTNPGHAAQPQFFPVTCADCHSTTSWLNATFNHTQYTKFSINHGNANGVCATCHTNSNDYSIFQCTNCHAKSQTDSNHQGVQGYVYNSVNCYQCHSSGQGG
jgi:hypothetical protein